MRTPCPPDELLVAMLDGRSDVAGLSTLHDHVDRCAHCARVMIDVAQLLHPTPQCRSLEEIHQHSSSSGARYALRGVLGVGGMGIVFRAWDQLLEREVALKTLRVELCHSPASTARYTALMVNEAKALARVSHPSVVSVYDIGVHEGRVAVAMELVRGQTLAEWSGQRMRTWREVIHALVEASRGVAAAHERALTHCDLKPGNLLVGARGQVWVCDFGLVNTHARHHVAPPGTPSYIAPELYRGRRADARSDQFAMCVTAFEVLCGARPFVGTTHEEVRESITRGRRAAQWPAHIPATVRAVVERGLSATPDARHVDMTQLAAALEQTARVAPVVSSMAMR